MRAFSLKPHSKLQNKGADCSASKPPPCKLPPRASRPPRPPLSAGPPPGLAETGGFHRGGRSPPRPLALSPRAYRDLIVLPVEATGELSSECILELAEKNIWGRKHISETNIPLYQLLFSLSVAQKIIIMKTCQFYHQTAKSPFHGAKEGGSAFK